MHENEEGALPTSTLNSKIATGCTQSEQDQRDQDARSSWDPPSESKSYRETSNNAVDSRIPGIHLSTVEQQDTNRQNKVKKMIEKLENHHHKESCLQDLSQTQKINKFSEESQDLIAEMNSTEIFELCENSSKKQCSECNTNWEIGIVYCSCGRNLKTLRRDQKSSKRTTTTSPQSLAMLLRRIAVAVSNMDPLNDKECTTRLKKCCKKLVKRNTEDIHPYLRDGIMTLHLQKVLVRYWMDRGANNAT